MERGDACVGRDADVFGFDFEAETGEGVGCRSVAHHGGGDGREVGVEG